MKALTPAERIARARQHAAAAWELARQITETTPGRERASLIIRTRSQANAAHNAVGRLLRNKKPPTPDRDRSTAQAIVDDALAALRHARQFST